MVKAKTKARAAERNPYDFAVLRDLRKRAGLTIGEVCGRSGVSAAVISRLERNQSTAELDTLYRLARVFGLTATDLLSLTERRRAQATVEKSYTSNGFRFRVVRYGNLQAFHGEAARGAHIRKPEIHHDDYELCWVLRGRIRLALPDEVHLLEAGQAVQFDAVLEHTYEALEDCAIIIIHLTKGKRF